MSFLDGLALLEQRSHATIPFLAPHQSPAGTGSLLPPVAIPQAKATPPGAPRNDDSPPPGEGGCRTSPIYPSANSSV